VNTNPQFDGDLPLSKAPKGTQQDPKMGRGTSYLNRSSGSGLLTTSRKHGTSKTSRAKINHWVGVGRKYAMNRSSPLTFKPSASHSTRSAREALHLGDSRHSFPEKMDGFCMVLWSVMPINIYRSIVTKRWYHSQCHGGAKHRTILNTKKTREHQKWFLFLFKKPIGDVLMDRNQSFLDECVCF
jgi:hypothetical protein